MNVTIPSSESGIAVAHVTNENGWYIDLLLDENYMGLRTEAALLSRAEARALGKALIVAADECDA